MGMKYKDPVTGQLKELSLKAADTLPIGTIVDYDGEEVPEGWEQVEDNPKLLWTNPNTTAEFHAQNITLSSSDYDILEWYFRVARDKEYVMVTRTIKGWGGKIINYNDDGSLRYRYMNRNNDISYGITSPGFDGALIPMYVIGYKTGLFS